MGNVIAGAVVFLVLGFAAWRIVRNIRRGKSACGCGGCSGSACPRCGE